jgi:hypothetical protein
MNELQIRLTADIKDLQSALSKAKATLKSFESETSADSEKSNVGFRRKIGLIEQLTVKAKGLKLSLTQATNEKQIAGFNAQLEQTNTELTRLNALGKNFANSTTQSFDKFRVSAGAANGSAIAFNRIIQDSPFGIIGVGNNIQQFTEQLSALKIQTGSTGSALKVFFSSLITPANLAILAVSAITSAWTAYSLGLFDAKEETKETTTETERLNQALNNVVNSLSAVDSARLNANKSAASELVELELLNSVLNDTSKSESERIGAYNTLLEKYPRILGNLSEETALVDGLGESYLQIVRAINQKSAAIAIEDKLVELYKEQFELEEKVNKETQTQNQLLKQRAELVKQIRDRGVEVNETATTLSGIFGEQTVDFALVDIGKELSKVNQQFELLGNVVAVNTENALAENSASVQRLTSQYSELSQSLISLVDPLDKVEGSSEGIKRVFDLNIALLQRFGNEADNNKKKIEALGDSFTASLEQQQKSLFQTIATLKQNPTLGLNAALIQIYTSELEKIDALIGSIASKRVETEIPNIDVATVEGFEGPDAKAVNPAGDLAFSISDLEAQIAGLEKLKSVTNDSSQLAKYSEQIANLRNQLQGLSETKNQTQETVDAIVNAFSSLGAGIAASLNIGDRALRGFVTTLLSATPKIIGAIISQAAANTATAKATNIANAQQAGGNAIVTATEGAKALGPVGLALLPVFIAGAVALVSSAFSKVGSGGGGSVSAGTGSSFTNRREFGGPVSKGRAYIVGEKRPELFVPNTSGIILPKVPSMDYSGASMSSGAMQIDVNIQGVSYGDDILFTVQQAQIRRGVR